MKLSEKDRLRREKEIWKAGGKLHMHELAGCILILLYLLLLPIALIGTVILFIIELFGC